MKPHLVLLPLTLLLASCGEQQDRVFMESPLAIVVKLEASEACGNYEAARNFIDVEKVYSAIANKEGKTSEEIWKEFVEFNYSLGRSSKAFTSCLPFYKYKIIEIIKGNVAEVKLIGIEKMQRVKEIIYRLSIDNKSWKVVAIEYLRN